MGEHEFAVRVDPEGRGVDAFSTFRLPFEPTGRAREFRDRLRNAVRQLSAAEGERLLATYVSTDRARCDVENLLLYNVGPSSFVQSTRYGLVVSRQRREPSRPDLPFRPVHHAQYRVEALPAGETYRPLVSFDVSFPRLPTIADAYWLAAKTAKFHLSDGLDPRAPYEIRVELKGPATTRLNLAALVKPMADGLLCGLMNHTGPDVKELATRIGGRLGQDSRVTQNLLQASPIAPLGVGRVVWVRATGVQWNPPDDTCDYLQIQATRADASVAGWALNVQLAPYTSCDER